MKTIILIFYRAIALTSLALLFACSGVEKGVKSDEAENQIVIEEGDKKKLALEHFIDGNVLENQGNFSLAVKEYERALLYDTSAGLHYALARAYMNTNQLNLALSNVKQAIRLDSSQVDYYDLLADVFSYGKQADSAAAALELAMNVDPKNIQIQYKLARLYETKRPLKAIEIYEKITDNIGPDWSVLYRISELYRKLNNTEGTIAAIERLLTVDPSNVGIKKTLIQYYILSKRYDDALNLCSEIIEIMPSDIEIRQYKSQILLEQNKWVEAANEYEYIISQPEINLDDKINIGATFFIKAISDSTLLPLAKSIFTKLDSDTSYWHIKLYLGAIALSEKDDSVAIENFRYVTENANWNVDAWIRLGGLYFDNRKYSESEKVMREAIVSFPENFAVNLILGLSLAQNSKYSDALPYLKRAVDLNQNDINALSAYAFTLNQLKDDDKAIFYLQRALSLEPNDVNLIGQLALIYNAKRVYEKSDSLYERALELDPGNGLISNNFAYSFSVRGVNLERALSMVNIALETDSMNSAYLDTKGWVLYKLGNYADAKIFIERAIELGGESAVLVDHLADTEFKLGNNAKAIELWNKAFELDPTKKEIEKKIEKGEP